VPGRIENAERGELLVLSARSRDALADAARNLAAALRNGDLNLEDVAFTLQVGRKAHEWRSAVFCRSLRDAPRRLQPDSLIVGDYRRQHTPQVVLLLPGEGISQSNAIRDLYRMSAVFKQAFDACAAILRDHGAYDLHELLRGEAKNPRQARGLRFACEYSLASCWLALGIRPAALQGRGDGEYVAACLAEVLTPEAALRLADAGAALPETRPTPKIPLVEAGAEPSVRGAIVLNISEANAQGAQDGYQNLLESIGRLWTQGVEIDWTQLHAGRAPRRISLPGYPFQRGRHWIERSATNRVGPAALVTSPDAVRAAVPGEAVVSADAFAAAGMAGVAGSDDIQRSLQQIWAGVLGLQTFGINDNFFDLGGDSVMATRVFARVREELGVELPIAKMFECATLRQMYLFVAAKRNPDVLDHFSEAELQEVLAMTET
jgi:acyl transferase domain-containing protein